MRMARDIDVSPCAEGGFGPVAADFVGEEALTQGLRDFQVYEMRGMQRGFVVLDYFRHPFARPSAEQ